MRLRQRVGMAAIVLALSITGCASEPTTPEVTTGTLPAAASAALDCMTSMRQRFEPGRSVVFMAPDATADQIEAVRSMLAQDSGLRDVRFVTQDEAYAHFKELVVDSPQLLQNVTPERLPPSFEFVLSSPASSPTSTNDPLARYRSAPGVTQVITAPDVSRLCAPADPAMIKAAQRMIDKRYGSNSLIVFMQPKTDPAGVSAMRESLLAMPEVRGIVFLSKEQALEEFTCLFKDQPDMIGSMTADVLPTSFRIDVGTDEALITSTAKTLEARPGVEVVVRRPTPSEFLREALQPKQVGLDGSVLDPDCPIDGERVK